MARKLHDRNDNHDSQKSSGRQSIQLGPRPFFLVNDMADSPLKEQLQACTTRESFQRTRPAMMDVDLKSVVG